MHNVPVHFFIAISEPSTINDVIGDEESIAKIVGHAEYIPRKIIDLDKKLNTNGKGKWYGHKIGEVILRECSQFNFDILRKLGVKSSDIMPGVHCPECRRLGMQRKKRSWHCPKCNKTSKQAHLRAMEDYFLLVNKEISNKECR